MVSTTFHMLAGLRDSGRNIIYAMTVFDQVLSCSGGETTIHLEISSLSFTELNDDSG
jgi:hypothetical protein